LLPLLGKAREGWGLSLAFCVVASLGFAVTAGFQPAFSNSKPQRLDLKYAEQDGKAWWLASPVAHLPPSLRAAANFSAQPQRKIEMAYVAPAGAARDPAPEAMVTRRGDDVTLDLHAPGDGVTLLVPQEARLQSVMLGGISVPAPQRRVSVVCATQDCGTAQITLKLASPEATTLTLLSLKRGVPTAGAKLLKARPDTAVPSQEGDQTVLAASVAVPAR
jgi:hypothetical protein